MSTISDQKQFYRHHIQRLQIEIARLQAEKYCLREALSDFCFAVSVFEFSETFKKRLIDLEATGREIIAETADKP